MTKKPRTNVNGLPAVLFWGLVWQAGAMLLGNPLLLPTPVQVVQRLLDLTVTAAFWQITFASIGRILLGVVCGIGLGVL